MRQNKSSHKTEPQDRATKSSHKTELEKPKTDRFGMIIERKIIQLEGNKQTALNFGTGCGMIIERKRFGMIIEQKNDRA